MGSQDAIPRSGFERDSMPLAAARSAFEWLVAGPHPVSVDGRLFPSLPARRVPLNELRDRLLHRRCPQTCGTRCRRTWSCSPAPSAAHGPSARSVSRCPR